MWDRAVPAFRAIVVGREGGPFVEAVELAGGRVAGELHWGEPLISDPDTILVLDATDEDWEGLGDELLAWAQKADVVCCGVEQLDDLAGALLFTDAQFLCAPSMADRVAALAVAAGLADRAAAPAVREGEAARLRHIQAEVARIAATLARLAADEEAGEVADRRPAFDAGAVDAVVDPRTVRATLRARRLRDGFFGAGLFEDPAWDMLLDLFAAELEGARVSVSSLCIAAAVAPTTALRWLNRLVADGLIERRPDPRDKRRAFVALSRHGSAAMQGYMAALGRNGLTLG